MMTRFCRWMGEWEESVTGWPLMILMSKTKCRKAGVWIKMYGILEKIDKTEDVEFTGSDLFPRLQNNGSSMFM